MDIRRAVGLMVACAAGAMSQFPAPAAEKGLDARKNIRRTMTLLETSTPQKRDAVRILFYG